MLIDRPNVVEGSFISNTTVQSGPTFPASANLGELFYLTAVVGQSQPGLYSFGASSTWDNAASPGVSIYQHVNDDTRHMTAAQNLLLDGVAPTVTSTELNYIDGVTAPIQTQLDTLTSNLSTHTNDQTVHVTAAQKTLLNGLNPGLTATELNYVDGVTSPIQTQFTNVVASNNSQDSRLTDIETNRIPLVQSNLDSHMADNDRHLSVAQNTLLDSIQSNGIVAADVIKLSNAASLSSSIPVLLNGLEANKLSRSGGTMTGNITMASSRITGLQTPVAPDEPATKDYVDSFVQGLHWVGSVNAATTTNISLTGLQTVDTVPLVAGNRVLVKNQNVTQDNGIYVVASGAWTRAADANISIEVENSAVFVLEYVGASQSKSTWIQTAQNVTIGTTPISFTAFSGPVVNTAGNGIDLGVNGSVSAKAGAGLTFDSNGFLIADTYSEGGLMLTINNTTQVANVNDVSAQLALTNTGVALGTYSVGSTSINSFTVDAKGRITGVGTTTTITPAFTSITGKPTTVSGYGITDAVLKTGDTMSGDLTFSGAGVLRNSTPAAGTSWLSTGAYGISQGDGKTHFGYLTGGIYNNYIRGANTIVEANMQVGGSLTQGGSAVWTVASLTNLSQLTNGPAYITAAAVTWANVLNKPTRSNYTTAATLQVEVARELGWKNFGNNYTIFDASASTSPSGAAISNTNSQTAWAATYPTLMGWNGTSTYGVRVDSARLADLATNATTAANATTFNGQAPSFYQTALGYTPVQQGGGTGQGTNKVYIGWGTNVLRLQVDSTDFGSVWPHGISGNAATATTAVNQSGGTVNATTLSAGSGAFVIGAGGTVNTLGGNSPTNGVIRLTPNLHLNSGNGYGVYLNWDNGGVGGIAFSVGNGATSHLFYIDSGGNTTANGDVTAYSDRRLKTNIKTIDNALDKVSSLRGVTYNRIDMDDTTKRHTGVIAQEVEEVLPEVVKTGDDGIKSVSYGNMVGLLIEAIKELRAEVQDLKSQLNKS